MNQSNFRRTGFRLFSILLKSGFFDFFRKLNPARLTVLNYHRINDPWAPDFDMYKPNVSAVPNEFNKQMVYLHDHYKIVSISEIVRWLKGDGSLPKHAAMVTFDDGYLDNYQNAYPILAKNEISGVIFLATKYIGSSIPFYWDLVAYCFSHSPLDTVELPLIGRQEWSNQIEREALSNVFINKLKKVAESTKNEIVDRLPQILKVSIPSNKFDRVTLNWDEVNELSAQKIEFGSHTITHPILTRIEGEQLTNELRESKLQIEKKLGKPTLSFAYPNGGIGDFDSKVIEVVKSAGYNVAFSLLDGPTSFREIKQEPLSIRRIYIGNTDTLASFAAKLTGAARLFHMTRDFGKKEESN